MFWCDLLQNEPIFGPKRIKSRRMRWVGHVAHVGGEERCIQGFGGET